ncbi:MAG: META domain-containing protein [Flavobacteriaceae bacterium]|nr:META domain-containing protein [Flavobacteriaceae bacterium]
MKYLFLIIILLIFGACTSTRSVFSENLADTEWVLEDNHLKLMNEITLRIEEGRVSGNASCNNYFGNVIIDTATRHFSVGKLGVTRKACSKMSPESYFLKMLEKTNKYRLNRGVLELYQDQVLLLKFKKK